MIAAVNNKKTYIGLIVLVFAGLLVWLFITNQPKVSPKLDEFAKCLSQKGAIMYGAYWCPHCQNQKKLFSDSFEYINYVECTTDPKKCEDKKIAGYPTWDFADGSRIEGEMSLQTLAEKTSCQI